MFNTAAKRWVAVDSCDHCGQVCTCLYYNNEFELLGTMEQVRDFAIGKICLLCLTKGESE